MAWRKWVWGLGLAAGCSWTEPVRVVSSPHPAPKASRTLAVRTSPAAPTIPHVPSPTPPRPVSSTPTRPPSPSPGSQGTPTLASDHLPSISPVPQPAAQLTPMKSASGSRPGDGSAAAWRSYAEKCVAERNYPEASRAFTQEAAIYRRLDPQAARVEELKAARYASTLQVYRRVKPSPRGRALERLEPPAGCYVGAFIDRDDRLASHAFGSQTFGDIGHFNSLTDKRHASFFTYLRYGNAFPRDWANYVKENGAICHLAWEPGDLTEVKDDDYLRRFIADLKAYDHPVILRFAGEMNGEWTPYHSDPKRYRQAFRLIHRQTRECPKVAVLWCPNSVPSTNFAEYYPGDDGCDWVGVNLYSVLYLDNDPKSPGDWIHPVDLLDPVYRAYASRKPIAIGEYAASHRAACVPKENVPFAQLKMAQLYSSLPLRYPQVRMVNWYDCNNLVKARAGRQLNNYQLTDSSHLLDSYETQVNNGYFLGPQEQAAWQAQPLASQQALAAGEELKLHFFARSYVPAPILYLKLDGQWRWRGQLPLALGCNVGRLPSGAHQLEVLMADMEGHLVESQRFRLNVP